MKDMAIDTVALKERIAKIKTRSIKTDSKLAALDLIVRMTDLTTLEGDDTPKRVKRLCDKAIHPAINDLEIPSVAAVCVYPRLVPTAVKRLEGSGVSVASVATGFPAGQQSLKTRLIDVRQAAEAGAGEIDMVISRNSFLSGDEKYLIKEVEKVKKACGDTHLKVILEVGELGDYETIRRASLLAIKGGADFIKTSTGKIPAASSLEATLVMLEVVRDWEDKHGVKIGVKSAGGIRSAKEAIQYLVLVAETVGEDYLTPDLFRFGASSLLNDVVRQILKQKSGVYEGDDYLTIA